MWVGCIRPAGDDWCKRQLRFRALLEQLHDQLGGQLFLGHPNFDQRDGRFKRLLCDLHGAAHCFHLGLILPYTQI